jgi:hypothetical protein
MLREQARRGLKVVFGRPNGEQTLGVIEKVNPSKAKVRTLEARGSREAVGVIWHVPYSLMKVAEGQGAQEAQAAKTPVAFPVDPTDGVCLMALRSLIRTYGEDRVLRLASSLLPGQAEEVA